MNKIFKLLTLFLTLQTNIIFSVKVYDKPVKAICVVPIADLIGDAFETINPNVNIKEEYKKISISPDKGKLSCPRIHQMLFNEQAEIIEEYEHEYKINISTVFYQNGSDTRFNCTYCTLKENLFPIEQIINHDLLPASVDFKTTTFDNPDQNVVTLILPFYEPFTKKIYSSGTRFISRQNDQHNFFVEVFDPSIKNFIKAKVNKKFALAENSYTNEEKIKIFLKILNLWTNLDNKFAPFVLGGISMTSVYTSNDFTLEKTKNCLGDDITFFRRQNVDEYPISGFDCSGLIARAAQIAKIPYFFKNTTTLAKFLKPLQNNEEIENGDLIWFHGYAIIIVDKDNGICIEARGYSSGYGKLNKLHLSKIFKNVNSIEDLKNLYFNNSKLEMLNSNDETYLTINNFKILKLNSVWSWNKNNN